MPGPTLTIDTESEVGSYTAILPFCINITVSEYQPAYLIGSDCASGPYNGFPPAGTREGRNLGIHKASRMEGNGATVSESVSNDGDRQSCPPSDALPVNVFNRHSHGGDKSKT